VNTPDDPCTQAEVFRKERYMRHLLVALAVAVIAAAVAAIVRTDQSPARARATATNAQLVTIYPEAFHTAYELRTKTGDGQDLVVISGYAEIDGNDLRGNADGTWNRRILRFNVGPWWQFGETDIVPVVSPSSIMNVGAANNAGWAVDSCDVIQTEQQSRRRQRYSLECRVGVRDSDGYMFRVNYYVTMTGTLY
jgi:hypothetical protein